MYTELCAFDLMLLGALICELVNYKCQLLVSEFEVTALYKLCQLLEVPCEKLLHVMEIV
jgi:hypothetical protein